MAKRFTSTKIWAEDWFMEMPNDYKMLWFYALANCSHSGIFKVNLRSFCRQLGVKIDKDEALKYFNDEKNRIRVINNSTWYFEDFFVFQYGPNFNGLNRVHASVYKELVTYDIIPEEIRGIKKFIMTEELESFRPQIDLKLTSNRPQNEDIEGVKDKDKDKDRKNEKEREENFSPQQLPEVKELPYTTNDMIMFCAKPYHSKNKEFQSVNNQEDYERYQWFKKLLTDNENAFANILYSDYQVTLVQFKNTLNKFTDEEIVEGVKLLCGKQVKKDDRMVWRINEYIGYYQKNYKKASKQANTAVYTSNLDEFKDDFKR